MKNVPWMVFSLVFVVCVSRCAAESLAFRSGFEGASEGWHQSGEVSRVMSPRHGGVYALKLCSGSRVHMVRRVDMQVDSSYVLRLSLWVKTDGVQSVRREGMIRLRCHYAGGIAPASGQSSLSLPPGTSDWRKVTLDHRIQASVRDVEIAVSHGGGSGAVYLDDLCVEALPRASAGQPGVKEVLRNGSFDEGDRHWHYWNSRSGTTFASGLVGSPNCGALTGESERGVMHQVLSLDQSFPSPIAYGASVRLQGTPPGKRCELYFVCHYQDGTETWKVPGLVFTADTWQQKTAVWTPPKAIKSMIVYVEYSHASGMALVDDVFLQQLPAQSPHGACRFKVLSNGRLLLENDFLSCELDPVHGGCVPVYHDRLSGASFCGPTTDLSMFTDRVADLDRQTLYGVMFGYKVLHESEGRISVQLSLDRLPSYPFVRLHKIFTLERESSSLSVTYRFENLAASMAPVVLTPYFRNGLFLRGESTAYCVPGSKGLVVTPIVGGELIKDDLVAGWSALRGESGRGISCEFDLSRIEYVYGWLSPNGSTLEWKQIPVEIPQGSQVETTVRWTSFAGLSTVSHVENGIASSFVSGGIDLCSGSSMLVMAHVVAEDRDGRQRVLAHGPLGLRLGEATRLSYGMPEGENMKSITVSLLQGGNVIFEAVRPLSKDYVFVPRKAKAMPARVPSLQLELSQTVETPHVAWCKPYAGGRSRVLALVNPSRAREVVELMQRMDVDCETVRFGENGTEIGFLPEYYLNFSFKDANKSLQEALQRRHDALVVSGYMWQHMTERSLQDLVRQLQGGTRLILIAPPENLPASVLPFTPLQAAGRLGTQSCRGLEMQSNLGLSGAGWPVSRMNRYRYKADAKVLAHVGKVPLAVSDARGNCVLAWQAGGSLLPCAVSQEPTYWNDVDYSMQLLIKLVRLACQRAPGVELRNLSVKGGQLSFALSKSPQAADLKLQLFMENLLSGARHKVTKSLSGSVLSHVVDLPGAVTPGITVVSMILYDGKGRVLDFGSSHVNLRGQGEIHKLSLSGGPLYQAGDVLKGVVEKTDAQTVCLGIWDSWGRNIAAGQAAEDGSFALTLPESSSVKMYVRAEVFKGGILQARRTLPFFVSRPYRDDDYFLSLSMGSYFRNGGNRFLFRTYLQPFLLRHGVKDLLTWWIEPEHLSCLTDFPFSLSLPGMGANTRNFFKKKNLYEQSGDRSLLRRNPCLHDEAGMKKAFDRAEEVARRYAKFSPSRIYLGDENSLTAWAQPFDYCFSPDTLSAFRQWLRKRYSSLEELNREWETSFESWSAVMPMTTAEIRKKAAQTRNYAAWSDHRAFMDVTFTDHLKRSADTYRRHGARKIDISGLNQPTAYDGIDLWRLSKFLDFCSFYRIDQLEDVICSLGNLRSSGWFGYGRKGDRETYDVWKELFRTGKGGGSFYTGSIFWNPDWTVPPSTQVILDATADCWQGLGRQLEGTENPPDVWIHFSMASIRAADLEGRLPELIASRLGWMHLLQSAKLQYQFVSYEQIEQGALNKGKGAKMLILPYSMALSAKEVQEIRRFVSEGGGVLADRLTGIMDGHCRLRPRGQLDDVFGLEVSDLQTGEMQTVNVRGKEMSFQLGTARAVGGKRSFVRNSFGHGKALFLNTSMAGFSTMRQQEGARQMACALRGELLDLAAQVMPKPWIKVTCEDVSFPLVQSFLRRPTNRRDVHYLCLLREPTSQPAAELRLTTAEPQYVYDLRAHRFLGRRTMSKLSLKGAESAVLAFLPYEVRKIDLKSPSEVRPGDVALLRISMVTGGKPADHSCRLKVRKPNGELHDFYSRNVTVSGGSLEIPLRFALNDAVGDWRLEIEDVISGKKAGATLSLLPLGR